MTDQELVHLLALQQVEGVGDIVAKKLITHCGNAIEVFKTKTSQLANIDGKCCILNFLFGFFGFGKSGVTSVKNRK